MRITLFEDVDLTTEYLAINTFQGGNRVGTDRNTSVQKFDSAYFRYKM